MSTLLTNFTYTYLDFYKIVTHAKFEEIIELSKDISYQTAYRFYNTSIVKIYDNVYLYAVRISWQIIRRMDDSFMIIPGNDKACNNIEHGKNFWWNHWGQGDISGEGTIFFVGNHKENNMKLVQIDYIPRVKLSFYDKEEISAANKYIFHEADLRVLKKNNQLYLHDSGPSYLYKLMYDSQTNILKIQYHNFPIIKNKGDKNRAFTFINEGEPSKNNEYIEYNDTYVKDLSDKDKKVNRIVKFTLDRPILELINWYYFQAGVRFDILYTNMTDHGFYDDRIIYRYIKYDKFIISGQGSDDSKDDNDKQMYGANYGIMPAFSFTTPHLDLDIAPYGKVQLGVGHIKIHTDDLKYPYLQNSNIQIFRDNLYADYKKVFGDRYIRHKGSSKAPDCKGYIYMIYFYFLYDNNQKMKLSDSFLPLNLNPKIPDSENDKDYKFSLVFPMGLEKFDSDNIIVTCGEGDFYSIALEFKLSEVINLCKYDVANLDLSKYNYYILATKNNKTYIRKRLQPIYEETSWEIVGRKQIKSKIVGGNKRYKLVK